MQSWIYEALKRVNPSLAREVHESSECPFTLSPLGLADDGTLGFELTLLDDDLERLLLEGAALALRDSGQVMPLGKTDRFACRGPFLQDRIAIEELWDGAPPGQIRFHVEFRTPTATKAPTAGTGRMYDPHPAPGNCFASWLRRWNRYAPDLLRLEDTRTFLDRVRGQVELSRFAGSTIIAELWSKNHKLEIPGFVGEATFTLRRAGVWGADEKRLLVALTRWADWCGTGVELTRGMGQTRLVGSR